MVNMRRVDGARVNWRNNIQTIQIHHREAVVPSDQQFPICVDHLHQDSGFVEQLFVPTSTMY